MLDTFIGIVSFGYSIVAGVKQGKQLANLQQAVEHLGQRFERMPGGSLYLPDSKLITDTSKAVQDVVKDTKTISGAMEKMQKAIGSPVATSRMILTPEKTKLLLSSNPWDILLNVHPYHESKHEAPHGMMPVMFEFQGLTLVGYQSIGALRLILGIDISHEQKFWLPSGSLGPSERIARNARCPCNSGKRFKHCCGRLA